MTRLPSFKKGDDKVAEYCKKCGSMLIMGVCRNREAHDPTYKKHIWLINGREYRFKVTLTKEEAEKAVKG